ncbi:MAG: SBBP repeat-containing protein, partial [Bacteroidia bacterium]
SGNLYVVGRTESSNFSTLSSGSAFFDNTLGGVGDGFILKFNNSGSRIWATYLGGDLYDKAEAVVINNNNEPIVTGNTYSWDFPIWNPWNEAYYQPTKSGQSDAFIAKFSSAGIRQWVTYYGGTKNDFGLALSLDNNGGLYISGYTESNNFPFPSPNPINTFNQAALYGSQDAFVAAFNNNGRQVWGTFLGGNSYEYGHAITTDGNSRLYAAGNTNSSNNFPLDAGGSVPYFQQNIGGSNDGYITRFDLAPVIIAGLDDKTLADRFISVFPNPSIGLFNIVFDNIEPNSQLEITNLLGE